MKKEGQIDTTKMIDRWVYIWLVICQNFCCHYDLGDSHKTPGRLGSVNHPITAGTTISKKAKFG